MIKKLFVFILCSLFQLNCFANTNTVCDTNNLKVIKKVIAQYLNTKTAMPAKSVDIIDIKCSGNYASAKLHPKKPVTDEATVYLQKNKRWDVLSLGTQFEPEFLAKIPAALR